MCIKKIKKPLVLTGTAGPRFFNLELVLAARITCGAGFIV